VFLKLVNVFVNCFKEMVIFLVLGTCVTVVRCAPSKAVVALSVALIIAVAMCVYLCLYPRGSPSEAAIPATLPVPQPEWVKTVTEVVGERTRVYVTNICPWCRPELTKTLAKATVGPWEISIVRIVETEYIRYGDEPDAEVYKAREGTRFVVVTARIKHVSPSMIVDNIDSVSVITSAEREYTSACACIYESENPRCMMRIWNASKELISKALPIYLHFRIPVYQGDMAENDFVFMVPGNEKPVKLKICIRLSSGEEFRGEIPLP
jgi:hypothetical protein